MNALYFLAAFNLFLNEINCVTNQFTLKFEGKTKSENVQESSNDFEVLPLNYCKDEEYLQRFIAQDNKTQVIWITWNRTKSGDYATLPNICSVNNGLPVRRRCLHFPKTSQWEKYNNQTMLIDCRISMFCKPEAFDHYVVQKTAELKKHHNTWKQVNIGEYSFLQDLCLQPNGLQLTRKCFYDVKEQRARWTSVDHLRDTKCFQLTQQQAISGELNTLHESMNARRVLAQNTLTRLQTAKTLLSLLKKPQIKLLPADVHLACIILKDLITDCQDVEISTHVLRIAHSIMSTDSLVLRVSAEVNATNTLLEMFENYLDGLAEKLISKNFCHIALQSPTTTANMPVHDESDNTVEIINLSTMGVYAYMTRNISVFFVNPFCALISGIAIYDSYQLQKEMTSQQQRQYQIRHDSLNGYYYRFIYMNESINDILHEPYLELASFVPIDIWNALQRNSDKLFLETNAIVFKIYAHDGLFVEQNLYRSRKPFGKILSISLPGFKDKLPGALPFIFRPKNAAHDLKSNKNTGCGYWNYSSWISSGVYTNSMQNLAATNSVLCSTDHLTQFSFLLGGSYRQSDLSDEVLVTAVHQQALDTISLIGCSLSLLGLLGIWITALLFESWRSQASNKVLLNMCVSLTLQMVLFLFINTDDISESLVEHHHYTKCIVLGALLQYSILVLFTWMLIVAILQFQRYVTVVGIIRPKHYIIKSALIAWCFPLIPTLLVALLDAKSYIPTVYQLATDTGVCYPSGNGLRFGVILPIFIIVLTNFSIFLYVLYSISHTLSMSMQRHEKQMVTKQIRLSILLFFLLGISWIFGIFAFIKAGIVFSYLFCLTATLQGFVLFIYFVILDETSRKSWQKLLCPACAEKSRMKKIAELQSMTTATTSVTHDRSSSRDH